MSTLTHLPTEAASRLSDVVSEQVRARLRLTGATQADLAEAIGTTQTVISDRLRGRSEWRIADLELIAAAFDIEPAELLQREAPRPALRDVAALRARRDSNPQPSDP